MGETRDGKLETPESNGSAKTVAELETKVRKASALKLLQVHVALLFMQLGFAGHQVLSRIALTTGLSQFVYAIYRNGIAFFLMTPFAYVLEKKDRPKITRRLVYKFFLLGFTGIVGSQQLFLAGLIYTSATFAATMQNAVPVITFALAWSLGLERVRWGRRDGVAKSVGTLVCVCGAVLMSVYRGPAIVGGWNQTDSATPDDARVKAILGHTLGTQALRVGISEWQIGSILLLINCISWAAYLILQAPILKECPAPLTITAFTYFFGSLQVGVIMLIFTGGQVSWSLSWGPQLIGVVYAGVISSGINFSLQSWAIQRGGPLLVSLYTPAQSIIVAILSVFFLGDPLYLGSVLGGLGEVAGLYLVTWGQVEHRKQDTKEAAQAEAAVPNGDEESGLNDPLLVSAATNASAISQPLSASAGAEISAQQREQRSRRDRQVAAPRPLPSIKPPLARTRSLYHDEPSSSFSPHHFH